MKFARFRYLLFTLVCGMIGTAAHADSQQPSLLAFGDSIMAGYSKNGDLRLARLDFVSKIGQKLLARSANPKFETWNLAVPGFKTSLIRAAFERLQIQRQHDADVLLMNGGGNNILYRRKEPLSVLCDLRTYESFVPSVVADWSEMLNLLRQRRPAHKPTLVLGLYYPPLNDNASKSCGDKTVAEIFLPYLAEANYEIRRLALRDNHTWVDLLPVMNCPTGLRETCEIIPNESLGQYQERMMRVMKAGILRDPSEIDGGLIQADGVHPNRFGHQLISETVLASLGIQD